MEWNIENLETLPQKLQMECIISQRQLTRKENILSLVRKISITE